MILLKSNTRKARTVFILGALVVLVLLVNFGLTVGVIFLTREVTTNSDGYLLVSGENTIVKVEAAQVGNFSVTDGPLPLIGAVDLGVLPLGARLDLHACTQLSELLCALPKHPAVAAAACL